MGIYLGVDIGTSGTKTIAIDEKGNILSEATQAYKLYHPKPLWSEQTPDDWWQATVQTIQSVVKQANLKSESILAIGLSGQMHGAVFLDKNNSVIRDAILWNDQRTTEECLQIENLAGGRSELIKLVANPALTGFTAPKILWLRKNEPANFDKLHKVLLPKDEIRRRLTGQFATDVSDASGMLVFDVQNRCYSKKLLEKLHLDLDLFAPAYESSEITGKLTKEVAELLGLTTNCLVVAGAGDCAAGAIGNGIVNHGLLSTSIGSSGVVFVHSDDFRVDPSGRLHTFCHAVSGKWHLMGVNLASGLCLQWFKQQLCNGITYDELTTEAEKINPGADGLFFLPYLSGERTPHADPDARACMIGLTATHTRAHMTRAIMEGVTYALNDSLVIMRELKIPIDEIRASGGGATSQLWRQMQADIFGQSISLLNAEHGAAYGAALLAATGQGAYSGVEEACTSVITTQTQKTNPDKVAAAYYEKAFPLYQDLYHSLKDNFKTISRLTDSARREQLATARQ